jgi:hypothetical protein
VGGHQPVHHDTWPPFRQTQRRVIFERTPMSPTSFFLHRHQNPPQHVRRPYKSPRPHDIDSPPRRRTLPPPRTDPWQSQPLAVYPFSSIGSEALKVDLFVIWAVMKGYDQNAELSPIMPGTYRLVNGEEPMVGFNLWVRRRRIMVVWKCRSCIGWRSRSTILRV